MASHLTRNAIGAALVFVGTQFGCGSEKTKDPAVAPLAEDNVTQAAAKNLSYSLIRQQAPTKGAQRDMLGEQFRQLKGARFGGGTIRRSVIDRLIPLSEEEAKAASQAGDYVLTLADAEHVLQVGIMTSVTAGVKGSAQKKGRYLSASLQRFNDTGQLLESTVWDDTLTIFFQAGVKGIENSPALEPPWPSPIAASAQGDEFELTRLRRAEAFFKALDERDASAAASLVGAEMSDRDVAAPAAVIYHDPADFEAALNEWIERSSISKFSVLDSWAAKDWVVAEVAHAFRLSRDLPGHPGTEGRQALSYELWVLQFEGDKIARRLRFRDSWAEDLQLGSIDLLAMMRARLEAK